MSTTLATHPTTPKLDVRADKVDVLLTANQLAQLLAALQQVGAYGEVHLVVRQGEIRFLRMIRSVAMSGPTDWED